MDCIYYLVNIYFFKVLYFHTPLLGGWNEHELMVFVAGYLLVDAVNMTVFSSNLWFIPQYINQGQLDYYLIRPVSPLFFLSLREFSASSFVNLLIAMGFFLYSLLSYPGVELVPSLFYVLLLCNGFLLHYCLHMLTMLPVFWTQSTRGFIDLFFSMGQAMERPDRIYRGWIRIVFTTILPFAIVASFPARIFLEGFDVKILLHIFSVTAAFWFIMLFVWKKGLRNYSSASS